MALLVLSICPFDISVGVGTFVTGLSQISSFFSYYILAIDVNAVATHIVVIPKVCPVTATVVVNHFVMIATLWL